MAGAPTVSKSKTKKLDLKLPDDIKEKTYITKQVDTSIAILDSPENDVVLESLLFLSKYADIRLNNLNYLQQKGLVTKLLNLFQKNVCILRLALRLLNVLLALDTVLLELDQEIHDEKIIEISNLYVYHSDLYVKEFCVSILSKLAVSCRITSLIFRVDLLNPVLSTIKTTQSLNLLESTLAFFYELLNTPGVLSILPEVKNFDVSIILTQTKHTEDNIAELAFKVVQRLTSFGLEVFQRMFQQSKLVETLLGIVMDTDKKKFHTIALDIIENCMNSEETSSYFIESLEFLNFCLWVKTCESGYLLPCVDIFEKLSKIPKIRQILFDLSVEDSILFFLRSEDKIILNKTCRAISNMSEHKYCCDHMLTPMVLKTLVEILERTDEEDPENEVALKTISDFCRRSLKTIDLLYSLGSQKILLDLFKKGNKLSEDTYLRILEILYKFAIHPVYQKGILNEKFFVELLKLLENGPDSLSILATEIITYFTDSSDFQKVFLSLKGPSIVLNKIKTTSNLRVLKGLLLFMHSVLSDENWTMEFLRNNIVSTLSKLPNKIASKAPLINTIISTAYNIHLPTKFFQLNRLEITDKLKTKFYLINGNWTSPFPFLEILEALKMSTLSTVYIVDYTYEVRSERVKSKDSKSGASSLILKREDSLDSVVSSRSCGNPYNVRYGKISADPFLPRFLNHLNGFINENMGMDMKIRILAEYVDTILSGPKDNLTEPEKVHQHQLHLACLKDKLGTNVIPIGFLRIGFHCERALLFKALADRSNIPCSLVKSGKILYYNEVALFEDNDATLKLYIVDLVNNIGNLLMVGSREANQYCSLKT
nr:uncharacterized protein LOC111516461 [Leptinotarsa decemlineata]